MSQRARNYLAGLSTGYLVAVVSILVGLWLTPFTLRYLDRQQYAIFTLASDILMWLGLLDLGITAGMNVQVAQLTGKPDQEKMNRLASTGFFSQTIISALILLVGAILAAGFPRFFAIRPDLAQQATMMFFLMAIGSACSMTSQTFSGLLVAHQQIFVDNLIRLALIFVRTFFTVVFLTLGWSLLSLAVANLIAVISTALLALLRVRRFLPQLQIRRQYFSAEVLRSTAGLGIWFSLGSLAGIVITSLDRVVTARVLQVELVTTLSLTGRLYALTGGLLQQITNNARPMLGQLVGQEKLAEVLRVYRNLFALSTGGAVVAAACIWSVNAVFVRWWVGEVNYGGAALDLALALNMVVHAWVLPNRATLSAAFIVRPQTLSRMFEGALNLSLAILLAQVFGVLGVVASTAIAGLLTSMWYLPYLTAKMFHRRMLDFVAEDTAPILKLIGGMLPITLVARHLASTLPVSAGFFAALGLTALGGALLLWFVVFDKSLKGMIVGNLARIKSFSW